MNRPIIPPGYVNVPSHIIYDSAVSPAVKDTYIQLRGLAWGKDETPELSLDWLEETLKKSRSTLYGHLAELRDRGWLLFSRTQTRLIIVRFADISPVSQESRNLDDVVQNSGQLSQESRNLDDANLLIKESINSKNIIKEATVQNSGQSVQKSGQTQRDPLLDHPGVKIYREIARVTANPEQRKKIEESISDMDLWTVTIKHWLGHGWSKLNVSGMIDSYHRGGKDGCSMCRQKSASNPKMQPAKTKPTLTPQEILAEMDKSRQRRELSTS